MNLSKNHFSVRTLAIAAFAAIIPASLGVPPPPAGLSLSSLYSFTNAATPAACLVQGTNGNFYGTTMAGGAKGNYGAVFMVTPGGVFTNLVLFEGTNGEAPDASLYLDADGYFYGTTSSGGANNDGTVFKMSHSGVFTNLFKFSGGNGANPMGGVVRGPKKLFYGTTSAGGSNKVGEVFAWSPSIGLSNLYSFDGTNGSSPRGGVVVGLDGNLYGTTFEGGANGLGTVFQLSQSNKLKTLVSFSLTTGAFPWGLVQSASSNLFGTTFSGGTNDLGSVFKVTYAGRLTSLASFNVGTNNGSSPKTPLLLGQDGYLYGTTEEGGAYDDGVIFRISTGGGTVSNLVSFAGTNGAFPFGGLMQASNGNLYGTTTSGGASGFGNIFELSGFPATIFQEPTNQSFALGATNHFTVGATGSAPLSFQWVLNGTKLTNGGNISGATNRQLTIGPEAISNAGSYSVVVTNAFGSVTSTVAALKIPVPTLTITSPKTNTSVTSATLTVHGTAAGNYGVTNVEFQLNGGTNWTSVTNKTQWTNWSATVVLQGGSNTFKAYSVDPIGQHSQTNSVTVFYVTPSPLTLKTSGFGTISRSFTGTNLEVGANYTVTAVPKAGNLFSNWTGSITATNNPLTFLMVSNMTLTANFVTNSFLGAVGTYHGLFYAAGGAGARSSGLLGGLTVGKLGAYSGTLYIGATNYRVTGSFDVSGSASNQIARTNVLGPLSLAMHLNWNATPPQITGTVQGTNGGAWTAELTNELAGSGLGSADYTLLIPPGTNAPTNSPGGYGYALITNHLGTATVTGALADGAAFSQNIAESQNLRLAFYAAPYTNGPLTNGLLLGWLDLSSGAPAGSLTWIRPAMAGGLFTNGYTNVVAVQSSAWTNLGPTTAAIPLSTGGTLEVSGGFLTEPLDFNVTLATNSTFVNQGGFTTNSFSGSIAPKTGLLNIRFGNGNGTNTTAGAGAVLQNQNAGGGFFTTRTNAGSVQLIPVLSPRTGNADP
jgi:uncharacterized repeat protein (TIGR03803 family)